MPEASPASDVPVTTGAVETTGQSSAVSTTAQVSDGTAVSSTAKTEGDKPKSMLDAVKTALEPAKVDATPASQAGSSPAKVEGEDGKEGSKDELSDDPTDEELAQLNQRTQGRIKKLLSQRNDANARIEALTPDAETGRMITEYVQKANLSAQEVNDGFEIMRLMKVDPFGALEKLAPFWTALQSITGQVLPPDLKLAVDEGRVTEEMAREIAQNRAKATVSTQTLKQTQQQTEQEKQQRAHEAHVSKVSRAASDFEKNWERTDPDYKLKTGRVHEKMELVLRRDGFFKTEADGVAAIKKAITEVEAELATLRPAPKAMNPIQGGGSSSQSKPAPKNMAELVDRVAAQGA